MSINLVILSKKIGTVSHSVFDIDLIPDVIEKRRRKEEGGGGGRRGEREGRERGEHKTIRQKWKH